MGRLIVLLMVLALLAPSSAFAGYYVVTNDLGGKAISESPDVEYAVMADGPYRTVDAALRASGTAMSPWVRLKPGLESSAYNGGGGAGGGSGGGSGGGGGGVAQ